ncbi:MAG: T9SS type A sorting domain-containing protein [bacterium]|nr:T9SS type A sorting domain-containing protein [bacterium]
MRVLLLWVLLSLGTVHAQCMDSLWRQAPGTAGGDWLQAVTGTDDGNAIGAGYVDYATAPWFARGHIRKFDPVTGGEIWSRSFLNLGSQDIYQDIQRTSDGGYICAGTSRTPVALTQNFWLMRVNSNGDSIWSRTFSIGHGMPGRCVAQAADGGFGIAGKVVQLPWGFGLDDWLLIKTNANGDSLWSVLIGDSSDETVTDMVTTASGDFLLAGYAVTDTSHDGRAALVNQSGQVIWNRHYNFDVGTEVWAATARPDGSVWLTGSHRPTNGSNRVFVAELDANGEATWFHSLDLLVDRNDVAFAIQPDDDGGAYLFGTGYPQSNQNADAFVAHVSSCGELISATWLGDGYNENIRSGGLFGGHLVMCGGVTLENAQQDMLIYGLSADTCNGAPCSFSRTAPVDSNLINWSHPTRFTWSPSEDPDGSPISYVFHLDHNYVPGAVSPEDTVITESFVDVQIDIPVVPLDAVYEFHWRVWATDGQDTVEAMNGEGWFQMDIPEEARDVSLTPNTFALAAYPNPFNPTTVLTMSLPHSGQATLALYDLQGRLVRTVMNGALTAGTHELSVDASDLATGLYFATLRAGTYSSTVKLVLMK